MPKLLNVLAISGSTRQSSSNLNVIKAITGMSADIFNINIYNGLTTLPHFNPDHDLDANTAPPQVAHLRELINEADAVLICSPEYAIGVPGTLKNAIDWTVSTTTFNQKPVALITAATMGHKAHEQLLGTLLIIESKITTDTQLLISSVKTKVNSSNQVLDVDTLQQLQKLIKSLHQVITAPASVDNYMPRPSMY